MCDNTDLFRKLGGIDWNNVAVGRHEEIKAAIIAANKVYYCQQIMFRSKQITQNNKVT